MFGGNQGDQGSQCGACDFAQCGVGVASSIIPGFLFGCALVEAVRNGFASYKVYLFALPGLVGSAPSLAMNMLRQTGKRASGLPANDGLNARGDALATNAVEEGTATGLLSQGVLESGAAGRILPVLSATFCSCSQSPRALAQLLLLVSGAGLGAGISLASENSDQMKNWEDAAWVVFGISLTAAAAVYLLWGICTGACNAIGGACGGLWACFAACLAAIFCCCKSDNDCSPVASCC